MSDERPPFPYPPIEVKGNDRMPEGEGVLLVGGGNFVVFDFATGKERKLTPTEKQMYRKWILR